MSYQISVPVDFQNTPGEVYDALADLARYPSWVKGMTVVSPSEHMHPGLRYTTQTQVLGRTNRSDIVVREMTPGQLIVIQSQAGLIDFRTEYLLEEVASGHCRLTANIQISFSQAIFNLARPVVEATAEAKIRGYLEILSAMMASPGPLIDKTPIK